MAGAGEGRVAWVLVLWSELRRLTEDIFLRILLVNSYLLSHCGWVSVTWTEMHSLTNTRPQHSRCQRLCLNPFHDGKPTAQRCHLHFWMALWKIVFPPLKVKFHPVWEIALRGWRTEFKTKSHILNTCTQTISCNPPIILCGRFHCTHFRIEDSLHFGVTR